MQTIHDLKIGDKVHLLFTNEVIIVESVSIDDLLINNKHHLVDILELNTNKDFVSFEVAKSMFLDGICLSFFTGEYETYEDEEEPSNPLYSEIGLDYGDTIEDLDEQTQYFIWNNI